MADERVARQAGMDPAAQPGVAPLHEPVTAKRTGYVAGIDSRRLARVAKLAGAPGELAYAKHHLATRPGRHAGRRVAAMKPTLINQEAAMSFIRSKLAALFTLVLFAFGPSISLAQARLEREGVVLYWGLVPAAIVSQQHALKDMHGVVPNDGGQVHHLVVALFNMGGLAAAAGLGQTLGSSVGGWLFGALAQRSFGWLTLPLVAMLILLVARSGWWPVIPAEFARRPTGGSRF